ncbi:TPA: hypothetical protein ACH3X2_004975 [Trebouxia sp. C0005]
MTGYLPVVSAASLLAADTPSEQLPSDELLQTWHRLRLAVLHSIWAASQIAQASRPTQAPDASEPVATLVSSPSSQQASSTSHHGHLARQLALKTIRAMIRNDCTKCNDDIRQISGVCSSWSRGKIPTRLWLLSRAYGELSTLRQMMEVPNEPGLSRNNGLENALLSDQSMASNPRKGRFFVCVLGLFIISYSL